MIHKSKFFDNFGQFLNRFPETDIRDLFSKGQMNSKRWLVDELNKINKPLGTVFLCAGWYGSLATFLLETEIEIDKIRSFDINPECAIRADTFNRHWVVDGWKFKASTLDILDMDYPTAYTTCRSDGTFLELSEMPNTIINTSCEHIKEFDKWYSKIPAGTFLVLQSNNYFEIEDHVNAVEDVEKFSIQAPMTECFYLGKINLEKYNRFMKIGIK